MQEEERQLHQNNHKKDPKMVVQEQQAHIFDSGFFHPLVNSHTQVDNRQKKF